MMSRLMSLLLTFLRATMGRVEAEDSEGEGETQEKVITRRLCRYWQTYSFTSLSEMSMQNQRFLFSFRSILN